MGLPYSKGTIWHAGFDEGGGEREKEKEWTKQSVFWSLSLNKEFPVPVRERAINQCKKISAWICQWLEAKALRRAWGYQQRQNFPLVNYFTGDQGIPGEGHSLQILYNPYRSAYWPNLHYMISSMDTGWFPKSLKKTALNPLFYCSLLGTSLRSSARQQHSLHLGCTERHWCLPDIIWALRVVWVTTPRCLLASDDPKQHGWPSPSWPRTDAFSLQVELQSALKKTEESRKKNPHLLYAFLP